MSTADSPDRPKAERLLVHFRGHILLFDKEPRIDYGGRAGIRLLVLAVALEVIRLGMVRWFYPALPLLLLVPLLLALALLSVRFLAGLRLSQIGFRPWREWTVTEKSYFVQL